MKMKARIPRIEVVCVGSELFTSRVNSHTVAIGKALTRIGLSIAREHVVGDDPSLMEEVFREALRRSDVVMCAGGLGPTFDDITRDIWARIARRPLRLHKDLLLDIQGKFRTRGIAMPPHNKRQAYVMKNARVLSNPFGTAPGQFLQWGKKTLILLPGPTAELLPMLDNFVLPELKSRYPQLFIAQKAFLIFGIAESKIDQMVRPWVARNQHVNGCDIEHGILASNAIITTKFKVTGSNEAKVNATNDRLAMQLRALLGDLPFGEDNDTLESIATHLLRTQKKTMAFAESCTGGLLSKIITDAAGASDIFTEGVVTYHNESKVKRLGVSKKTLLKHGAVSEQTAVEMARGIKRTSGADLAISVTGIAGPTGESNDKPVGLVWIALANDKTVTTHKFQFRGDRGTVRYRAAQNAFNLLRKELLDGR